MEIIWRNLKIANTAERINMIEGISKETLLKMKALLPDGIGKELAYQVFDRIILECTELDPWLPIDENTPKDRNLLLGRSDGFKAVGHYINDGYWVDQSQNYIEVTHYKLLKD